MAKGYNGEKFPSKKFQQVMRAYLYGEKLETEDNSLLEEEQTCIYEVWEYDEILP